MKPTNQLKNQHLLWRAGFGPMAENAESLKHMPTKELYALLLKTSAKKPEPINTATPIMFDGEMVNNYQKLTSEQKRQIRKQSALDIKNLNLTWFNKMISSEAQLREKMSLFWHGHFACRIVNIYSQQQLLNVIRENALGNFGDLLRATSKTPAMLSFLNNQQNNKKHPNENFAREVMELFTMGRGNYTENDVKEGARAFTGWGFNKNYEFTDRPRLHDDGSKTFLGKTGNFNGDDVINIILEQKACARFITQKIYKYLVNEEVDVARCNQLADKFYQNKYDIQKLLNDIFESSWFYDEKNIGSRIKSPVDLLVGIQRFIPMQIEKPQIQILFQQTLGQLLFYPPNVAGWPGGKSWIDSSSLMLRMRIPQILTNADEFSIKPKEDDDVMMGLEGVAPKPNNQKIANTVNWKEVISIFDKTKRENLLKEVSDTLCQTKSSINPTVINKYIDASSRESFLKTAIVSLMSTPEYQLC